MFTLPEPGWIALASGGAVLVCVIAEIILLAMFYKPEGVDQPDTTLDRATFFIYVLGPTLSILSMYASVQAWSKKGYTVAVSIASRRSRNNASRLLSPGS